MSWGPLLVGQGGIAPLNFKNSLVKFQLTLSQTAFAPPLTFTRGGPYGICVIVYLFYLEFKFIQLFAEQTAFVLY